MKRPIHLLPGALVLSSTIALADPTIDGLVISWPDDGWYQVQITDTYIEVCQGGRSCEVPESGAYNIINHTTGQRWENVQVTADEDNGGIPDTDTDTDTDSGIDTVTVTGNIISWPDDGWYQVQTADTYIEICQGGRSCEVPESGVYHVINHTTGQRWENVQVTADEDNDDTPDTVTVVGNIISWPDDGWYQVQNASTYDTLCEGGLSCTVPDGVYNVINHTTGMRHENIEVGGDGTAFPPSDSDLALNTETYGQDGYGIDDVVRVDVRTATTPGTCTVDDQSGCTLDDVNDDVVSNDALTVDIPVHVQTDQLPDDGLVTNGKLRQRGGGARYAPQKSYRLKLKSKTVLWRNERFFQLNKHPYDNSRIRNKLAFDMMSRVPHLPSFRTQLVNLWIDDGEGPTDYGLFTHVERADDDYLERQGLDKDGNLYKARDFRFNASDLADVQVDDKGKPLNKDRFESSLDIKEGKDHRALVAMLEAVLDPNRSFDTVVDQYFNANNVKAWMATNLLLRQYDATRHNFYLYNPSGSERFYFIPWDYDSAMGAWRFPPNEMTPDALRQRIEYGYAGAWENVFTSRYYRLPGIHEELIAAAEEIHRNHITDALIADRASVYAQLVTPWETQLPDSEHNPYFSVNSAMSLADGPATNLALLRTDFGLPMPPRMAAPREQDGVWHFAWDPAYDVTESSSMSYDLTIATDPGFSGANLVVSESAADGQLSLDIPSSSLSSGSYYARLVARPSADPDRLWQVASNYVNENGTRYYGVVAFTVP